MNQQIYRMDEKNPSGMIRCSLKEAAELNPQGWGIFVTVNDFDGERRMQNLKRVNAYAIDMDSGTKDEMSEKIQKGLIPSMVVETKRGYHVWWLVSDADPEYWNAIVLDRLVPFYGADQNARDLCRVLRMPGFLHMKNPNEPFLVKKVFEWEVIYKQSQFVNFYPDMFAPKRKEFLQRQKKESPESGFFWDRVWALDCIDALEKLSGTEWVGREEYSFRPNANGRFNIFVNGKQTSCFVDEQLRIGSLSGGGPSIYQWLRWYGNSAKKCVEIIKTSLGVKDGL